MKRYYPPILLLGMMLFVSVTAAQHLTSAKLYMKFLQFDKAEESAMKATEKDPDDGEAWFVLGKARFELKKYPEMIAAFEKAVALDPEEYKEEADKYRLKVWADSYNAGVKYYQLGRDTASYFKTAIDWFKIALLAQPESTRTHYICALSYYGNNQIGEAIKSLNTSLEKNPRQAEELRLLGRLHEELAREKQEAKDSAGARQEYHVVLSVFEKLYELDHSNADNLLNLVEMYEFLGQSDKARGLTSEALAGDPNNRDLLFASGMLLLKQDSCAEAIQRFSRISQLRPDSVDAVYSDATLKLGVAYLQWGIRLKKEADADAEAALKAKKKEFKEDTTYLDKLRAAIPYFVKATELKPENADIWQQLGKLYAFVGMGKEAEAAYKKYDAMNK